MNLVVGHLRCADPTLGSPAIKKYWQYIWQDICRPAGWWWYGSKKHSEAVKQKTAIKLA